MHSNIYIYMSKYMPLFFYGHEKNKLKLLMCLIRVSQSFWMVEMTETNNKQIVKSRVSLRISTGHERISFEINFQKAIGGIKSQRLKY